jgi:hypothetical protein
MKIGSYIAGARQKFNDSFAKIPYAGKVLTHEIRPGEALKSGLTGLVICGALVNSGCVAAVGGAVGYHLAREADSGQRSGETPINPRIGMAKWKDYNKDGTCKVGDQEILGYAQDPVVLSNVGFSAFMEPSDKLWDLDATYTLLDSNNSPVWNRTGRHALVREDELAPGEYTMLARFKYRGENFAVSREFNVAK